MVTPTVTPKTTPMKILAALLIARAKVASVRSVLMNFVGRQ